MVRGTRIPHGACLLYTSVPAKIVRLNGERTGYLDQIHVSDPTAQELCALRREYLLLAKRLGESSVFPCDEELDAKEPPTSE